MKTLSIFIFLFFIYSISFSQSASIDNSEIISISDSSYKVTVTVTPKKATSLLVSKISSKEDTEIKIGSSSTIKVVYKDKLYSVILNNNPTSIRSSSVVEIRKQVLKLLRKELKIT